MVITCNICRRRQVLLSSAFWKKFPLEKALIIKWNPASMKTRANEKCLLTRYRQTYFGDQAFYHLAYLYQNAYLICAPVSLCSQAALFGAVWSSLIQFEGHQTFYQKHFSCSRIQWAIFLAFGQLSIWHAYHACSAACIHSLICFFFLLMQFYLQLETHYLQH